MFASLPDYSDFFELYIDEQLQGSDCLIQKENTNKKAPL